MIERVPLTWIIVAMEGASCSKMKAFEVAESCDETMGTDSSRKETEFRESPHETNIARDSELTTGHHLDGRAALHHWSDENISNEPSDHVQVEVSTERKYDQQNPPSSASRTQVNSPQPTIHQQQIVMPSLGQPMQAAEALFRHLQHQVQLEALQQTMVSAAALGSRLLMGSSLASTPSHGAPLFSSSSRSVISNSASQQAINLQHLGGSNLVFNQLLANQTADILFAQQIRLAAGLPLDPLGQSLLTYLGNQHSRHHLSTDSASLSAVRQYQTFSESSPSSAAIPINLVVSAGGSRRLLLYMPSDDNVLAENQIAIRQNLELFEATQADVDTSVAGRRKPLVVGQVGIQCVHCSQVPIKQRKKGARYYPAKLSGIYQAAQNMAYCHLAQACEHIDFNAKSKLLSFQKSRSNGHGGKTYWSQTAKAQGVSETERLGLKFN